MLVLWRLLQKKPSLFMAPQNLRGPCPSPSHIGMHLSPPAVSSSVPTWVQLLLPPERQGSMVVKLSSGGGLPEITCQTLHALSV